MKVTHFNDAGSVERPTAYGTLKTRVLEIAFDFVSWNGTLDNVWALLGEYGFDVGQGPIDMHCEPEIRRLTIRQKWWDRSKRKGLPCDSSSQS